MKRIEAIIRTEKLNPVKNALEEIGIIGMTVYDVHGRGEQKGLEFTHRAGTYRVDLLPKTKIEIVAGDADVDKIVAAIIKAARTGDIGDGKIFVSNVDKAIKIRTGEASNK